MRNLENTKVRILTTGGTIDGFDAEKGIAPKESAIPSLLAQAKVSEIACEQVFAKDSRLITPKDTQLLAKRCRACEEKAIVITHGTFTMAATARFLAKENLEKTIVLTGSMMPAAKSNSDAQFNLGFALAVAQFLPKGVWVAMNGKVFSNDNVKKNEVAGTFENER